MVLPRCGAAVVLLNEASGAGGVPVCPWPVSKERMIQEKRD